MRVSSGADEITQVGASDFRASPSLSRFTLKYFGRDIMFVLIDSCSFCELLPYLPRIGVWSGCRHALVVPVPY